MQHFAYLDDISGKQNAHFVVSSATQIADTQMAPIQKPSFESSAALRQGLIKVLK